MTTTTWDDVARAINFSLEPRIENIILQLSKEAKIIDFGCGYGRISQKVWGMGYRNVVGYDGSPRMIERGQLEFPHLNLNTLTGDTIPEPTESVDFVFLCAVLTCIPNKNNRQEVISELYRILRVGGKICVCEFAVVEEKSYSSNGAFYSTMGIPMKHFHQAELEKELECFSHSETKIFDAESLGGSPARVILVSAEKSKKRLN